MDTCVKHVFVLFFILFTSGLGSWQRSNKNGYNICDKTKQETCRYIWQNVAGNQYPCGYCPYNLLNDENSKNHQCFQNNENKRDQFEIENNLFPYCYPNLPGVTLPSCGKLPNITSGEWDCGKYISPQNVPVYRTCKLTCDYHFASVHNATVVRCDENRKWNTSLDTLTCHSDSQPEIQDQTENVISNEDKIHKILKAIIIILIIIATIGMVSIVIFLVYFCCKKARVRRQKSVSCNQDNKTTSLEMDVIFEQSPKSDEEQGCNENSSLLSGNGTLRQEMELCENHEMSNNQNENEDYQSNEINPTPITPSNETSSDHNIHNVCNQRDAEKGMAISKEASFHDCLRLKNVQSETNANDLHVSKEPQNTKVNQSLLQMNKLLDSSLRLSSLMNSDSESRRPPLVSENTDDHTRVEETVTYDGKTESFSYQHRKKDAKQCNRLLDNSERNLTNESIISNIEPKIFKGKKSIINGLTTYHVSRGENIHIVTQFKIEVDVHKFMIERGDNLKYRGHQYQKCEFLHLIENVQDQDNGMYHWVILKQDTIVYQGRFRLVVQPKVLDNNTYPLLATTIFTIDPSKCSVTVAHCFEDRKYSKFLKDLCYLLDPLQRTCKTETWKGLALWTGEEEAFLESVEWHRKGDPNNGPTMFILANCLKPKGIHLGHIVFYFIKYTSRRKIVDLILNSHQCNICESIANMYEK